MGDLWRAQGAAGRHQAQRCYATALRLDQTYAPAWRGLGDLLREEGNHGEAVSCYQVRVQGIGLRISIPCVDGQSAAWATCMQEGRRKITGRPSLATRHGSRAFIRMLGRADGVAKIGQVSQAAMQLRLVSD